ASPVGQPILAAAAFQAAFGDLTRHGARVDLDPVQARRRRSAAAGHECAPADLVHAAQVRILRGPAFGEIANVELQPADVPDRDFGFAPVARCALRNVADEPRAAREFYD